MWTKGQLVDAAYEELALANYSIDRTPEESQAALRRMDAMVAGWESRGMSLGYSLPASPDGSSLNDPSGIADGDAEAVFLNLAIRLAASKGKALPLETKATAEQAMQRLLNASAQPSEMLRRDNVFAGAGNRRYGTRRNTYLPNPQDQPVSIALGGDLSIASE